MSITCVISRVPRSATAEERIRQDVGRKLMVEHGYGRDRLEVELTVRVGSSDRYVDIAVFQPGVAHRQENVVGLVECKRPGLSDGEFGKAVAQLKSYMAVCVNAKWGLATDGTRSVIVRRGVRLDGSVSLDEAPGHVPSAVVQQPMASSVSRPRRSVVIAAVLAILAGTLVLHAGGSSRRVVESARRAR